MIFKFPALFGKKVVVVGDFNNWNPYANLLKKKNDYWFIDLNLNKGTYYYKFLIDDMLWVNDPEADFYFNDGKGALNSVVNFNNNDFLKSHKDYGIITDISLSSCFNNDILMKKVKGNVQKSFNVLDRQVFVYHSIKDFVGEIELSYVWCRPDFKIYDCESILLTSTGGEKRLYNYTTFMGENIIPGLWKLFILINGSLVIKKTFRLESNLYYHRNGKILTR